MSRLSARSLSLGASVCLCRRLTVVEERLEINLIELVSVSRNIKVYYDVVRVVRACGSVTVTPAVLKIMLSGRKLNVRNRRISTLVYAPAVLVEGCFVADAVRRRIVCKLYRCRSVGNLEGAATILREQRFCLVHHRLTDRENVKNRERRENHCK